MPSFRRLAISVGDLVYVPGLGHHVVERAPNSIGFFRLVGHSRPVHVDAVGLQNLGKPSGAAGPGAARKPSGNTTTAAMRKFIQQQEGES
jgi:hypothetical protein